MEIRNNKGVLIDIDRLAIAEISKYCEENNISIQLTFDYNVNDKPTVDTINHETKIHERWSKYQLAQEVFKDKEESNFILCQTTNYESDERTVNNKLL